MVYLWLLFNFVLGFVHGRMFGGWLSIRGAVMRLTPALWGIPAWLMLDWRSALVMTAASMLQWNDGHRFDLPMSLVWRYSRYALIVVAVTSYWPALLVGPASGLCAWLFNRFNLPAIRMPWDTDEMRMFDGWAAYWEAATRGLSALAWTAAAIYSTGPLPPLVWLWDWLWPALRHGWSLLG